MRRWRTVTAALGLCVALALPLLFVPRVNGMRYVSNIPWDTLRWEWVGTVLTYEVRVRPGPATIVELPPDPVLWWLVGLEELLVLLVGGALLAWAVRRDRRAAAQRAL